MSGAVDEAVIIDFDAERAAQRQRRESDLERALADLLMTRDAEWETQHPEWARAVERAVRVHRRGCS